MKIEFQVKYSRPSVPAGNWFQEFPHMPKSADAQVPDIKWHGKGSPPYPWVLHLWIQPTTDRNFKMCKYGELTVYVLKIHI